METPFKATCQQKLRDNFDPTGFGAEYCNAIWFWFKNCSLYFENQMPALSGILTFMVNFCNTVVCRHLSVLLWGHWTMPITGHQPQVLPTQSNLFISQRALPTLTDCGFWWWALLSLPEGWFWLWAPWMTHGQRDRNSKWGSCHLKLKCVERVLNLWKYLPPEAASIEIFKVEELQVTGHQQRKVEVSSDQPCWYWTAENLSGLAAYPCSHFLVLLRLC